MEKEKTQQGEYIKAFFSLTNVSKEYCKNNMEKVQYP